MLRGCQVVPTGFIDVHWGLSQSFILFYGSHEFVSRHCAKAPKISGIQWFERKLKFFTVMTRHDTSILGYITVYPLRWVVRAQPTSHMVASSRDRQNTQRVLPPRGTGTGTSHTPILNVGFIDVYLSPRNFSNFPVLIELIRKLICYCSKQQSLSTVILRGLVWRSIECNLASKRSGMYWLILAPGISNQPSNFPGISKRAGDSFVSITLDRMERLIHLQQNGGNWWNCA